MTPAAMKGSGQPTDSDRDPQPEKTPQAKERQEQRGTKKWRGHTVLANTVYDTQRQVSIGTAESNDIGENITVERAVQFVRSSESAKRLKEARKLAREFAAQLEDSVQQCREKGRFDLEGSVIYRSRFYRKKQEAIEADVINVIRKHGGTDGIGKAGKALADDLYSVAWRHIKTRELPGFVWAGTFFKRNNTSLSKSSGLMCVDFDKLNESVDDFMERLKDDPLIFWATRSPSGNGVKVLVRIPDDAACDAKKFLACFETFERYVAKQYPGVSLSVDKQAKAQAQLCYYTHDPDCLVVLENAYVLLPDDDLLTAHQADAQSKKKYKGANPEPEREPRPHRESADRKTPMDGWPEEKQWATIQEAVESLLPYAEGLGEGGGERNGFWTRIGYAIGSWAEHMEDAALADKARQAVQEWEEAYYAGSGGCVLRAFDGPNGSVSLGTLFMMAKEHGGWKAPWVTERGSSGSEKKWVIMEHVSDFQCLLPPIKCVGDRWYAGDNGLWLPVEQNIYEPRALKVLPFDLMCSKRAAEVMATFQKMQQVPRSLLKTACIWEDESQRAVLINCRNGLLRVTSEQCQLIECDAEKYCFTGQLAAAYDPTAACHTFERVLAEAQPVTQARELLVWWFGYALFPSLKHRHCLINYGPTGTSKTTIWVYGIGSVIGEGLTKHLSLSDICSTTGYSLPGLQHALLNIGGELDADELAKSSRFKLFVGGEPFEVRGIYGHPFTLRDYIAKLVFLTNHLPRFRSGTDAELARMRFLNWTQVPAVPDLTLQQRLPAEKDGIFSQWMVPSLQWVMEGTLPPDDDLVVRREFAVRNDPVGVFVKKCCVVEGTASITKDDLFGSFKKFVEVNELNTGLLEKNTFGHLLLDRCCGKVRATRPRGAGGHRIHTYVGIRLTDEFKKECDEHGAADEY